MNINHQELGVILPPYRREQRVLPFLTPLLAVQTSEAEIGAFIGEAGCSQLSHASKESCTPLLLSPLKVFGCLIQCESQ